MAEKDAHESSFPSPLAIEAASSSESAELEADSADDSFLAEVARIPKRKAPQSARPIPRAGDTVGRFVVREELGRGGMGIVYRASDPTLSRDVALKVLFASEEQKRQRLLREARVAAALGHDGIVAIYDVGEDQDRAFIAMELVRGQPLRALLDARPANARALPQSLAKRIAKDLARVLSKAHAKGIVHRDLKPENVMIEPEGRVVLLDFGLVKSALTDADASLLKTDEGALVGTPSYMSPEQTAGKPVDAQSDVFSFGVMLYEMTTGRRPFVAKSTASLLAAIQTETPPKPSEIASSIDPSLERLILWCLQKDPRARPQNGAEVYQALEPTAKPEGRALFRSYAWNFSLAALALASLVIAFSQRSTSTSESTKGQTLSLVSAPSTPSPQPALPFPTSVVDLPLPPSANKDALVAYRKGLDAVRTGAAWAPEFQRAVTLDPTLAAAHVQLAALGMSQHIEGVRESLNEARVHSDLLSPRDQALLRALEPVVQREPADWAEAIRRLGEAIETYPGDAELVYLLALGHANYDDFDKAVELSQKAFALDPGFARAIASTAIFEAYQGRADKAEATLDLCLKLMPGSLPCLSFRARLEANAGRCSAMETTARQMIAKGAEHYVAYPQLASALAAKGESIVTVREALLQAGKEVDGLPKATGDRVRDRVLTLGLARAAMLEGDFEEALEKARSYAARVQTSPMRNDHGAAAKAIATILSETGNRAEAGRVALDYLDRQEAWEPDPSAEDLALASDATPTLLVIAESAGLLSREKMIAKRQTWLESWSRRLTPVARSYLWLHGFATTTLDERDAKAALEAQAEYGPLPSFLPQVTIGASLGTTLFFGGRFNEARTWLEQSCRSCLALTSPIEHTQAHISLGRVLEALGEPKRACEVYEVVVSRWGHAKPRSVSAEYAKERMARLGCERGSR